MRLVKQFVLLQRQLMVVKVKTTWHTTDVLGQDIVQTTVLIEYVVLTGLITANNNEFDFNMNNEYGKMVLNPDVVVRSRGVMEKCSMCIQMTQATILKAKKEGRAVNTDEFETACSSACTTGAMVFGDVNNEKDDVTLLCRR